jgi:hypothetical protein
VLLLVTVSFLRFLALGASLENPFGFGLLGGGLFLGRLAADKAAGAEGAAEGEDRELGCAPSRRHR